MTVGGLSGPVGPGATIGAASIVDAIEVRTAGLLVERGAMSPVIMCASAVTAERSRILLKKAHREHARPFARAIDQSGGG